MGGRKPPKGVYPAHVLDKRGYHDDGESSTFNASACAIELYCVSFYYNNEIRLVLLGVVCYFMQLGMKYLELFMFLLLFIEFLYRV